MATVMITGGTGLIGKRLTQLLLERQYQVILVSRQPHTPAQAAGIRYAQWNIDAQTIDAAAIQEADYIIHLAGAGVADKRWTAARKKEIAGSRVQSCTLLAKALQQYPHKIKAVVAASAIGWYGPDTMHSLQQGFDENDAPASDFLGETCRQWEAAADLIAAQGTRLVKLRTGIVLSNEGGAFPRFRQPVNLGVAAVLGSGEQVISWIHIDDLCRMYMQCLEQEQMQGVYNAVAPAPVTNKQLMLALAKQQRGKNYIPVHVPAFLLKIALGEMSIEVLKSTTVSAAKIRNAGFHFTYPSVEAALAQLLR